MKVLSIGLDNTAFTGEQRGDLINRLKQYSKDKRIEHIYQICYTPNKNYKPIKINNKVTLIPTNSPAKLFFPVDCKILSKHLDFDLVSCQDVEACGWAGMLIKISRNVPLVCNFFTIKQKGWFLSKVEKIVLKACNLVRVESQTQKELLMKSGFRKPIIIAPLGFDLEKFKPPKKRRAKNTVIYVGRLSPEKNVGMIIEAAKLCPDVMFIIVGHGVEMPKLQKQAKGLRNILFKGIIPHDLLKAWYDCSNALILTSKYEGVPTVVVEAMSNGLPVISTDLPDVKSIVRSGTEGYLIPQNDVNKLVDCIQAIKLYPNIARRMGKAGRKRVLELFGQDNVVKTVVDGWKSVIK